MGARQSKHGDNKQAESTALADRQSAEEDTAEKNSNVVRSFQKLTAGFGSPRLSTKLPLKDKRITIEGSIGLLSQASSKALSDLQQDTGTTLPSLKDLADFTFPFENAVFEGGGVKGIAYVGAVKVSNCKHYQCMLCISLIFGDGSWIWILPSILPYSLMSFAKT